MQALKSWLLALTVIAAIGGGVAVVETMSTGTVLAQPVGPVEDHWRYHDGRWSTWHQADKRWYYTDGNHWFYHNGTAWAPYRFDKAFGRRGFERGTYVAPGENVQVVLPNHKVYIAP